MSTLIFMACQPLCCSDRGSLRTQHSFYSCHLYFLSALLSIFNSNLTGRGLACKTFPEIGAVWRGGVGWTCLLNICVWSFCEMNNTWAEEGDSSYSLGVYLYVCFPSSVCKRSKNEPCTFILIILGLGRIALLLLGQKELQISLEVLRGSWSKRHRSS